MIELRMTEGRGLGVFAAEPIAACTVVAEWDGRVLPFEDSAWPIYEANDHAMQVAHRVWITSKGPAKFFNHSCAPNCVNVFGERIELITMRAIKPGEELTWDYDTTERPFLYRLLCRCGSVGCRGEIGTLTMDTPPLWARWNYEAFVRLKGKP